MSPQEMLDCLYDELHRGKVYECSLRSPTLHVFGLQAGDYVCVDPRPAILQVLLHELLHRLKPKWGEKKVDREAKELLLRMSDEDKAKWWRAYRKVKKTGPPIDVVEEGR